MDDSQATIELLTADMRDEHAAIVQYLQHAYAIGESGEACEIEGIARDEMRHFDWLAEAIVDLGGKPDLERGAVDLSGEGPVAWVELDVQAEDRAIAQYEDHIAAIDDPKIKRLLGRILSDERAHREDFVGIAAELEQEGATAAGPLEARPATGVPAEVVDALQTGVKHEYSVILQYLYHSFVMPQCEVGNELEMQAINEMQHLGWLAEELAERDGHPIIERDALELDGSPAEMVQADIDAERAVTAVYQRQIEDIPDEEITGLLARIRDNEVYHEAVFGDLLEEVQTSGDAAAGEDAEAARGDSAFTVGSLIR
jgi:bacterioferritin